MFKQGILNTRADLMMDIVIISIIVILPALYISLLKVKSRDYQSHKTIQSSLFVLLAIAVTLFEIDIRLSGGMDEIAKPSRFYNTLALDISMMVHLFFSISTAFIWTFLVFFSLKKFPNPPGPASFSEMHRKIGRLGMLDMLLTSVTGIELYTLIFIA